VRAKYITYYPQLHQNERIHMQVLIDNQDGLGAVDYAPYIQFGPTATIVRELNKPCLCTLRLAAGGGGHVVPLVHARIAIVDCQGLTLFEGYLPAAPELQLVGFAEGGPAYVAVLTAYSLDLLLDATVALENSVLVGQSAAQAWQYLNSVASSPVQVTISANSPTAGRLTVSNGSRWSQAAALLAAETRSSYRYLANGVQVVEIGASTHVVPNDDPGLEFETIPLADVERLASDITICGHEEPAAYVTEIFTGDGVTRSFTFTQKPFEPVAAQKSAIADLFQGVSINPRIWQLSDPDGHIALDSNGLSCLGGSGRDAESTIASIQQVELGSNTTVEAGGVQISTGSAGILLGLYSGQVQSDNCFVGFSVATAGSLLSVTPLINGVMTGGQFIPMEGHVYTLRLRVLCPEVERVRQAYFFLSGVSTGSEGGEVVAAQAWVELEIQDATNGLPGAPTILYAGSVQNVPAACNVGLFDSGSLVCSLRSVTCTQAAPVKVTSALAGSTAQVQYEGTAIEGAACRITTTGTLEFYPANIPANGAVICASYRLSQRAIARVIAASAGSGAPTESSSDTWIGTVSSPAAWSSTDCNNAAAALLQSAANSTVAIRGRYTQINLQKSVDVWPGDALSLTPFADGSAQSAIVRQVKIELGTSVPNQCAYMITFANDWAESLSIDLSATVPLDAVLPQAATNIAGALPSLSGLTVTAISSTVIAVDTGVAAPENGGFEIRRRDNTFGAGTDSDLLARIATTNIDIPRSAAVEAFYLRMYDGATPPNYSLFSAALFVNVPI
jgi:hypothetical protein